MMYLPGNNSGIWRLHREGFSVGYFMSPAGVRKPCRAGEWLPYACDNGLYRPYGLPPKPAAARGLIYGILARAVCEGWPAPLFAVVPDVPFDGSASRIVSRQHLPMMRDLFPSVPLAVAVQDGMGEDDVEGFDWIFVAGSDEWKDATVGFWCRVGRDRGMPVHLARVNERRRMDLAKDAGCASADGTGIWRGDRKQKQRVLLALIQQGLFAEA